MLASVKGTVIQKNGFSAVVECNGLGLELSLSQRASDLCEVGEDVFLYVHMQVSEAGISLFGFADEHERQLFRLTMMTKGVGGKVSIALLQHLTVSEVVSAVERNDPKMLMAVPGIGKKTADRICFELEGRIQKSGLAAFAHAVNDSGSSNVSSATSVESGVLDALESLGFDRPSALRAYKSLLASNPEAAKYNESDSIMGCLRILQPR